MASWKIAIRSATPWLLTAEVPDVLHAPQRIGGGKLGKSLGAMVHQA